MADSEASKVKENEKGQVVVLQEPQNNSESNNSSPAISQQPDSKQNLIAAGDSNTQIATQDIVTEFEQNAEDVVKEEAINPTNEVDSKQQQLDAQKLQQQLDAQTLQQQQQRNAKIINEQILIENEIAYQDLTKKNKSLQASFDHLNNANRNFNRCVNLNLNDPNLNDTNPNIIKPPYNTIWFYNRDEPYYEFTNFKENFPIKAALVPYPGSAPEVKSWPTSEHLFQAAKFQNTRREICDQIRKCYKPRDAFNMARRYQQFTDPNWHEINVNVMEWVVKKKFEQHPILAKRLLETGDKILVEHTELDRFWGDGGDGTGSNMLGIILMKVRQELRDSNYLEKLEKSRRKSVEGVTTTNNEVYSSPSESSSTNSLPINNNNDGDDDSLKNINPVPPPPPPKRSQNKNKIQQLQLHQQQQELQQLQQQQLIQHQIHKQQQQLRKLEQLQKQQLHQQQLHQQQQQIQQHLHQQQIQQQIQQELDQQAQLLQQLQLQPQFTPTPTPTPPPQLLMTGDGLIIDQSLTMQSLQNSPAAFYYGFPSSPTPPPSNPQNQPPYNPYS